MRNRARPQEGDCPEPPECRWLAPCCPLSVLVEHQGFSPRCIQVPVTMTLALDEALGLTTGGQK